VGPTATGKTDAGIAVALRVGGEVLTADSMQVYKLMDIGTAKPTLQERKGVPHHLIDLVYPDEPFSVAAYQAAARAKIEEVFGRDRVPLLVGGTGLYVKSLLDSYYFVPVEPSPVLRAELQARELKEPGSLRAYLERVDPAAASKIHPNDLRRTVRALEVFLQTGEPISRSWGHTAPPFDVVMFGLAGDREWLYSRIDRRVTDQVKNGLVEEVAALLDRGYDEGCPAMQGLGYKELVPHLRGVYSLEEAVEMIRGNTRRFAKRQFTWFRPDRRIIWLDVGKPNGREAAVEEIARSVEGRAAKLDE
jgi:tRNA dimethylallyltransferase